VLFIFRHHAQQHLGLLTRPVLEAGLPFRYLDLWRHFESPVNLGAASRLLFLGGDFSANDDLAFLHRELHLLNQAIAEKIPVFGICLGAQLLAKSLGAPISPNPVKEIGWFPLETLDAAHTDPVFGNFPKNTSVFQWHGETFDLPDGATWLARSPLCTHQAFRYHDSYGLQFHLEASPDLIGGWIRQDADCPKPEITAPFNPWSHCISYRRLAESAFATWIRMTGNVMK